MDMQEIKKMADQISLALDKGGFEYTKFEVINTKFPKGTIALFREFVTNLAAQAENSARLN